MDEERRVNVDHIGVVKEIAGKLEYCEVPLKEENTSILQTLEKLVEDEHCDLLNMQMSFHRAFAFGHNKIHQKKYDVCLPYDYNEYQHVSLMTGTSVYIAPVGFPKGLAVIDYRNMLNARKEVLGTYYKKKLEYLKARSFSAYEQSLRENVEKGMTEYKCKLKKAFLSHCRRYILAENFTKTLESVLKDDNILMYSSENIGWTHFTYKISEETEISVRTNFCYGSSSYFYVGIKYQNVDILPFSGLVKYWHANMADLIRYTRSYTSHRANWDEALMFSVETGNLIASDPDKFLKEFVMNEVLEMMDGLDDICSRPDVVIGNYISNPRDDAKIYTSFRNINSTEVNDYGVYPSEMLLALKAEKLEGAALFLDKLLEIERIYEDVSSSIERIKALCVGFIPELKSAIVRLSNEVDSLKLKITRQEKGIKGLEASLKPFTDRIQSIKAKGRMGGKSQSEIDELVEKYLAPHKARYESLQETLKKAEDLLEKYKRDCFKREGFLKTLSGCRDSLSKLSQ